MFEMSYTDWSDLVAMKLTQQRWRRLEETVQPSPDKDERQGIVRQALEPASLPLMGDDRCARPRQDPR